MSSIHDVLTKIGYDLRDYGNAFRAKPLYRDSDNNTVLIIDKETGRWKDFSSNQNGSLKELIKLTLNLKSEEDVIKVLGDYNPTISKPTVNIEQPKIFSKDLLIKLRKDYSYWEKRGINKSTIELFQGGVADNGKMAKRFVFPIFNDKDSIVGFAGRDISGKSEIKWKLLSKKSEWVFPNFSQNYIRESRSVILVESIGDGLSLWEVGVKNFLITFGLSLSSSQMAFLIKSDVRSIKILFNNDSQKNSSGNQASINLKNKLMNHFDEHQIEIITPPENDLNDMLIKDFSTFKDFLYRNGIIGV